MVTKDIYIIVRLDQENEKADTLSDEDAQEFISEVGYEFTAPEGRHLNYRHRNLRDERINIYRQIKFS